MSPLLDDGRALMNDESWAGVDGSGCQQGVEQG